MPTDDLSTGKVGKLLRVTPRMVQQYCNTGQLKCFRLPAVEGVSKVTPRRILRSDLVEFMRLHKYPDELIAIAAEKA